MEGQSGVPDRIHELDVTTGYTMPASEVASPPLSGFPPLACAVCETAR